jgi:hypothetical protein
MTHTALRRTAGADGHSPADWYRAHSTPPAVLDYAPRRTLRTLPGADASTPTLQTPTALLQL